MIGKFTGSRKHFTPEEDKKLINLLGQYGTKKWAEIAKHMSNRNRKAIREKIFNYLAPTTKKDPWTPEEDKLLTELYVKLGNKWDDISKSKFFINRSSRVLKYRFYMILNHIKEGKTLDVLHGESQKQPATLQVPTINNAQLIPNINSFEDTDEYYFYKYYIDYIDNTNISDSDTNFIYAKLI